MSTSKVYTPAGMILSTALSATPTNAKTVMDGIGINTDRDDENNVEWSRTAEIRASGDAGFEFTILNKYYDDPATATYKSIPANTTYPINVDNGHELVYFKGTGTLTLELYGSDEFQQVV